jgi:CheY-like chemotaxis protein
VLLVDDEPLLRRLAEASLSGFGRWQVTGCASGEEALAQALRDRPDVVLLDVQMPGLDGPGTLAALRLQPILAGVPVLFLTATREPDELDRLRALGAAGILHKPFQPMTLHREVQELVDALGVAAGDANGAAGGDAGGGGAGDASCGQAAFPTPHS